MSAIRPPQWVDGMPKPLPSVPDMPSAWWDERAEAASLAAQRMLSDPTRWDATERRAAAADAARGELGAATGRAGGKAVRAYRSRKGIAWPGHKPLTRGVTDLPTVAIERPAPGLRPARTIPDVREWQAFDATTARDAHALVIANTVPHRFAADVPPCECGSGQGLTACDRCSCGYATRRKAANVPCECGAGRKAECHSRDHVVLECESGRVIALRVRQAARLHASIDARTIRAFVAR